MNQPDEKTERIERCRQVSIRLTEDEYNQLQKEMKKAHVKLGVVMRDVLLNREIAADINLTPAGEEILRLLKSFNDNLNQYTKTSHAERIIYKYDADDIRSRLIQIVKLYQKSISQPIKKNQQEVSKLDTKNSSRKFSAIHRVHFRMSGREWDQMQQRMEDNGYSNLNAFATMLLFYNSGLIEFDNASAIGRQFVYANNNLLQMASLEKNVRSQKPGFYEKAQKYLFTKLFEEHRKNRQLINGKR